VPWRIHGEPVAAFGPSPDLGAHTVEVRAEQRQALEAELHALEGQLRTLSGGTPLAAFITAALAEDADRIAPALMRLADESARLDREKSEFDQTIGSEQNELTRMAGSARAAELTEEAEALLAGLETDVGHYVRLRLAATVLSQVVERYRERHQGPILKRSGALFRAMTGGAFQELRLEFDERGEAVLAGVRAATGEVLQVAGMSEGTADQLASVYVWRHDELNLSGAAEPSYKMAVMPEAETVYQTAQEAAPARQVAAVKSIAPPPQPVPAARPSVPAAAPASGGLFDRMTVDAAGIGGTPVRLNTPSDRQSRASSRSP
jgi:hypothetical protein